MADVEQVIILVLCGIDQFPESRSIVFSDAFPGDFSAGRGMLLVILAVRVEIEGNVCAEETGAFCGPVVVGSHGRWVKVVSMADDERFRMVIIAKNRG
jgi:hypothetical protein